MLALTRRMGETILISGSGVVEVTVIRIKGAAVKLAFDAPRSVRIMRKEIMQSPGGDQEQRTLWGPVVIGEESHG